MTKWEYMTDWLFLGEDDAGISEHGANGWELIALLDDEHGPVRGVFKRPAREGQDAPNREIRVDIHQEYYTIHIPKWREWSKEEVDIILTKELARRGIFRD